MTQLSFEEIQISHPEGQKHRLLIMFAVKSESAHLVAKYASGSAPLAEGTEIASWSAFYEPPSDQFNKGKLMLDDLRIDIKIETLRGIGLGSLLMLPIIRWAKSLSSDLQIAPIHLQASDASTDASRDRRNKFYEKLGFVFDYNDKDKTYGKSREMPISKLIEPKFKMSHEWEVVSLQSNGSVFLIQPLDTNLAS